MRLLRYFSPTTPYKLVYMLQQLEYDPKKLLNWLMSLPNFSKVIKRGNLVLTTKAKALLIISYAVYITALATGLLLIIQNQIIPGFAVMILSTDLVALTLIVIATMGKVVLGIKRAPLMNKAETIFKNHSGTKIAVLGSYGKTTMKELLHTVLSEKFDVEMTPGNKNVPISHARWAAKLTGNEDILVIEYGEGEPGDIKKLASLSHPNMAVMTGIAPNHLDHYKTLDKLEEDLVSIEEFVSGDNLYVNADAVSFVARLREKAKLYSNSEVNGWKISKVDVDISGTSFSMKRGSVNMKLHSKLLGEHNVGPLAAVVSVAYDQGMSTDEIKAGVAKTMPFEHRMEPRLLHGAWLIDDTYNGNLEGFKAGLKLLAKLDAKRKIYVTPGLVDQGEETERVHTEIGEAIARANPDRVVLMQNSNADFIKQGMDSGGFAGEVITETDPLGFYTGIEQFVAAGDLVLMQNDLPDAYSQNL